jgi:hypothetical protein
VKLVVWNDKKFTPGNRVKLVGKAGTFKPEDTGYSSQVIADAGHTGTVLWGEKRGASEYTDPDNEPVQMLRVRWDAATWTDNDRNTPIKLDAFDGKVHADYLTHEQLPIKKDSRDPNKDSPANGTPATIFELMSGS